MNKKIFILVFVVVITGSILFLSFGNKDQEPVEWQKKYPQLTNNVGYSKLAESVPPYQSKTATQQELIGKVTNQFGIRDDVLKLILTSIPESNVQATIAAIKMAQYYQAEIGVTDDKEMNLIANKASAASSCMNIPMMDGWKFIQSYDKIIRDTPARQAEQDRIEHLLSNHVISADYGIQSYDPKEQCDHFLGVN